MAKVYPVIHFLNRNTTLVEGAVAAAGGADGVFLINHRSNDISLIEPALELKAKFPKLKVGLNMLGTSFSDAADHIISNNLDMLWVDNCGVSSEGVDEKSTPVIARLTAAGKELYAGVAFKYQRLESYPDRAAKAAYEAGVIPTTTGDKTGSAPSVDKVKLMRSAIPADYPLALASGVTPENAKIYAQYCTAFLVATGISINDYEMDPVLLDKLVKACKS